MTHNVGDDHGLPTFSQNVTRNLLFSHRFVNMVSLKISPYMIKYTAEIMFLTYYSNFSSFFYMFYALLNSLQMAIGWKNDKGTSKK